MTLEVEREGDGRWLAELVELPGCMTYGATPAEARERCVALAFRILAERVEHGEAIPEAVEALFQARAA